MDFQMVTFLRISKQELWMVGT